MSRETGELRVNATGNQTGFQQMLSQMKVNAKAFSTSLSQDVGKSWGGIGKSFSAGIAGMLTVGAAQNFIGGLFGRANELRDMAEQFDISSDSIQRWQKALSKAGIPFTAFLRALETLRAKRQEAREDDKKLAPFTRLGIGEKDVRGSQMDDEQMLKRILGSNADRALIGDLVGVRGQRLRAALPDLLKLEGKDTMFTEDDIRTLDQAQKEQEEAIGAIRKWFFKRAGGRILVGLSKLVQGDLQGAAEASADFTTLGKASEWGLFGKKEKAKPDEPTTTTDPALQARRMKEQLDFAEKREKHEDRIAELQRQAMTDSEKRKSIEEELKKIEAERLKILKPYGHIRKPTNEEQKRLWELDEKKLSLQNDLKMQLPKAPTADNLAKVGGYTASSLLFSPTLNIQQQQLATLKNIERALMPNKLTKDLW